MPKTNAIQAAGTQLPVLSDEDITRALRNEGGIPEATFTNRMKIEGTVFQAGDDMYAYNPAKKEPAFLARIVRPLIEMQAFYFRPEEAGYAGRPDIADKFCKSHTDIPSQARKKAEDGTDCGTCPFNPFEKNPPLSGRKCAWRGDLEVQIIPESGQLEGDEPIWIISLPTTGIIEYQGTKREPVAGSVSQYNFKHKLARFAIEQAAKEGKPTDTAVFRAVNSLANGGVVAEFRLLPMNNRERGHSWYVVSLEPAHIIDMEPQEAPALDAGPTEPKQVNENYEDLPF